MPLKNSVGPLKKPKYNASKVWLTEPGTIFKKSDIDQFGGEVPQGALPFDSALEAQYYRDVLLPQVIIGLVEEVIRQPRYEILKGFEDEGVIFKPVNYIADFAVKYPNGRVEAVDVKGMTTDIFMLKRKLFLWAAQQEECPFYGVKLRVLKYVRKYGGWVTIEQYAANKKLERKRSR